MLLNLLQVHPLLLLKLRSHLLLLHLHLHRLLLLLLLLPLLLLLLMLLLLLKNKLIHQLLHLLLTTSHLCTPPATVNHPHRVRQIQNLL